jgi:hypothetical protein
MSEKNKPNISLIPLLLVGTWAGEFDQKSNRINEEYPMVLRVHSIDAQHGTFKGEMYWEKLGGSTPTIEGKIFGSEIEWTEAAEQEDGRVKNGPYDLHGSTGKGDKYIPQGTYRAQLNSDGHLVGTWYEPAAKVGLEGGTFNLQKRQTA